MKKVKIFSDADEFELENQINEFLEQHKAQIIDLKLNVTKDGEEKIITAALIVDVP